ncbi:hypothetical protein [Bradyrhizobium sp. HKCCYLS20291]
MDGDLGGLVIQARALAAEAHRAYPDHDLDEPMRGLDCNCARYAS